MSSNIEIPEAMLEGLLQTAVCWDVVGWRERARHLVLVLTDATYHSAGDGRVSRGDVRCPVSLLSHPPLSPLSLQLARIVQPHDGKCYVPLPQGNETVYYEAWDRFVRLD